MATGRPSLRRTAPRVAVTSRSLASSLGVPDRRVRDVPGPPHRPVDDRVEIGVRREPGQARRDRLGRDDPGDRARHGSQVGDRRVQRAGREPLGTDRVGQRPGGGEEHPLGDRGRLGHDRAEPETREDEHVVGLADLPPPAVDHDRVERRAGRDDRPAVGPAQDVERGRLRGRGRVRERQDDRPLGGRGHRPDDPLVERAGDAGRADQDGRPDALDRLDEAGQLGREPYAANAGVGRHSSRFVSSRSSRRSWTWPRESTRTSARRAVASDIPPSTIARRSSRAMPIPAAPAPTSTTRVSASVVPVARSPASTPATTTAAVPWMSSLNDGTRSR